MSWVWDVILNVVDACKKKEIGTSFDNHNAEARRLTQIDVYNGVRTEISKMVSACVQVSRICVMKNETYASQVFGTMRMGNGLLQIGVDDEKSVEVRATHMGGRVVSRIHSIMSSQREMFSQAEVEIRNRLNNVVLKAIRPAVKGTRMIYVVNVFRQLGCVGIGSEIIGTDGSVGISVCGRHEHTNGILSVCVQQFTALSISYYHRISRLFDVGSEVEVSRSYGFHGRVGCRLQTYRTEVKASVSNRMSLLFSLDERLSETLMLNVNAEIDRSKCCYGFGFSFEF